MVGFQFQLLFCYTHQISWNPFQMTWLLSYLDLLNWIHILRLKLFGNLFTFSTWRKHIFSFVQNSNTFGCWKSKLIKREIFKSHEAHVVCFVLFCFVCQAEISQTTVLHGACFVSSERSWWVGVHRLGLRLFGATVWKLLIIEPFFQWKLNKIETEIVWEFGGILGVVEKPLVS
jgi:hypothetical protein